LQFQFVVNTVDRTKRSLRESQLTRLDVGSLADLNRENVRHKTALKVLNDEIGSLKEEIMEVKQINRILSLQMKKMKEDQKKSCSPVSNIAVR